MSAVDRLKGAYVSALGIDAAETDWDNLEYRSIEEWDSVAHMELVAEIEDVFDVMLETDDVVGMSSFPEAIRILTRYGVAFDG
jgi:acyl carrier protein